MKPLKDFFASHVTVREGTEPHMFLENIRSAIVQAMRAGQTSVVALQLRVGKHILCSTAAAAATRGGPVPRLALSLSGGARTPSPRPGHGSIEPSPRFDGPLESPRAYADAVRSALPRGKSSGDLHDLLDGARTAFIERALTPRGNTRQERSASLGESSYQVLSTEVRSVLPAGGRPLASSSSNPPLIYAMAPCMRDVMDWIVIMNGLGWFLATGTLLDTGAPPHHPSDTLFLMVHWTPDTMGQMATSGPPGMTQLCRHWTTRVMAVPFDTACQERYYRIMARAQLTGASMCHLLLLSRNTDFIPMEFGEPRASQGSASAPYVAWLTDLPPRRHLDMAPLQDMHLMIEFGVSQARHGNLLSWLRQSQGLHWFLTLPTIEAEWAYLTATWLHE
jgi:hypothetical protein